MATMAAGAVKISTAANIVLPVLLVIAGAGLIFTTGQLPGVFQKGWSG